MNYSRMCINLDAQWLQNIKMDDRNMNIVYTYCNISNILSILYHWLHYRLIIRRCLVLVPFQFLGPDIVGDYIGHFLNLHQCFPFLVKHILNNHWSLSFHAFTDPKDRFRKHCWKDTSTMPFPLQWPVISLHCIIDSEILELT